MASIDPFLPNTRIAYFSMEIAVRPEMHTYAGGLGVLAGDTARASADLSLPMVFVTLISRQGYLRQEIGPDGAQIAHPDPWTPEDWATPLDAMVAVRIEGRPVWVRPWLHVLHGTGGTPVPVLLLDTQIEANAPEDRAITDNLYGDGDDYRLKQEIVLGHGGERMLRALGFDIETYHMNEGHAALLAVSLLRRWPHPPGRLSPDGLGFDADMVRRCCVFTTHTPVEAGHDKFDWPLAMRLLGDFLPEDQLRRLAGAERLNMTRLALALSGYINGVARRHAETTRRMYPDLPIREVTNGVHVPRWTHPAVARLFDRVAPCWAHEPEDLVNADLLDGSALWEAHGAAKAELIAETKARTGVALDPDRPILAFARRMTGYKRPDLLFSDPDRLRAIARRHPFQLVIAGKAHPRDGGGLQLIRDLHAHLAAVAGDIPGAFLPDYEIGLARILVAGADVWLNTPLPPYEASGTSGMKAALNGVPSLSVLDGWWVEGWIEGDTGWAIGGEGDDPSTHGAKLHDKLDGTVLPLWHGDRAGWTRIMRECVAKVGSRFNSHRMMRRYASEAYLR